MTTDGIKDALTIAGGVTLLLGVLWRIVVIPNLRREFGESIDATRKAVTEKNGDSSVIDRLDRIERRQVEQAADISDLKDKAAAASQHYSWSEDYVERADKRSDRLEQRLADLERDS